MAWVAGGALIVLAVSTVVFASIVRSLVRQAARERDLLLNQLMHLAGRTWQEPPAQPQTPSAPVEEDLEPGRFWASPEQAVSIE